ncbi:AIPR family protein [Daejeonella oryzae]|uniref:AIPR family protein n=1 Tax=Daejeonella oryzae TaxID=1122943 RepID=UPI0003F53873|nr:AIPR family protein [Daejeonella oryzae]
MEISEYLKYRIDLLDEAKDEDGFITESKFLDVTLPSLSDAKLLDSEDYEECYFYLKPDNIKINGYKINESEERLQVFIVNEDSINLETKDEDLLISQKSYYDTIFAKVSKLINKSIRKHLDEEIQDSSPVKKLINFISSSSLGLAQIDVIELFLISATATVEKRGSEPMPKMIEFEEEVITVNVVDKDHKIQKKEITVFKRLIDLNFLYNILISQGNREVLEVNFEKLFNKGIDAIKAADEDNFESFLCVLPGNILAELYKRYSTRMLEKNVRSFLQFKGVNQGIRDTIRKNPEHFIAYNNGLTITAVGAEIEKSQDRTTITSLKDFQIVNGGQTTATIYFSKKDGLDISKVKVMAKINVAKNADEEDLNELISNISRFSNAQSKVSNADLRSRNEQLIKLKSISESTMTPSGRKWFFERFKGEFNTLIRKNPRAKTKINNEYPKERRFTKEELAKYYMSWGSSPYLVKKGGDKIFRSFIEEISPEKIKGPLINRDFYEEVIAKIILFKELENIYGAGKNSMGQLRSAVVPYTISILFAHTTGHKGSDDFDLIKLWQREGLENDLREVLASLMVLMNDLIKGYSISDDYGEYSKRKELWDNILAAKEIKEFTSLPKFLKAIKSYALSKEEIKRRVLKMKKVKEIDFSNLYDNAKIFSRGQAYYKKLGLILMDNLSSSQQNKIDHLIYCINSKTNIDKVYCEFEKDLIQKIRVDSPDIFDTIQIEEENEWVISTDYVVDIYNKCLENGIDLLSTFQKHKELAKLKGAKYYAVFDEIGKGLLNGSPPTIKQIQSVGNISFDYGNIGNITEKLII